MPDKTGKQTQTKGTCKPVDSKKKLKKTTLNTKYMYAKCLIGLNEKKRYQKVEKKGSGHQDSSKDVLQRIKELLNKE
ncbi:hypothetical protein BUY13_11160 [Staphylococcus chromogenes]|nr:hypothetical protein BUY13_11160 [Staphylococcus chromogenes]